MLFRSAAFTFTVAGSASGAPHLRGHHCVRLRYGLDTRPHPEDEAVERLQKVGCPSPCSPSYRALAFPLLGFSPTEPTSLRWTHHRACGFHRTPLSTFGRSPWGSHEASVSISAASTGLHPCLIPFRRHTREKTLVDSLRVRWVLCSPTTFVLRTSKG